MSRFIMFRTNMLHFPHSSFRRNNEVYKSSEEEEEEETWPALECCPLSRRN